MREVPPHSIIDALKHIVRRGSDGFALASRWAPEPPLRLFVEVLVRVLLADQRAEDRLAIDVDNVAPDLDGVAARRDQALHIVTVRFAWIAKHDEVAGVD